MLLEALNLKLFIQDRLLIDAEHLHIDRKERIGLVGKNGSGKTTLLMALAGRRNPDEGTVTSNTVPELLPQLKLKETTKSGGEVTQEYIVAAISGEPELLFLDEPTTNLDTEHIEWLEKLLSNWQGAFVIVSHDRAFLDALCTEIWEIEEGKVKRYKGNYSDYIRQKELELARQKLDYEKYEQKKKQLEDALRLKQKKANRAAKTPKKVSRSESKITGAKPYFAKKQKKLQKAAKAIETRLEKLEKVEKIKEIPPIKMNLIHQETFEGRIVLRVNDVAGVVNGRVLWEETSFFVRGGDKLAVIGPNGCGKTTLLKKIVHREDGIVLSPSMKIGYFSQNLNILDNEKSILENVCSSSDHDETLIRTVLARLHFFRDDVYKRVGILSGGERVKVALAKLFVSNINTLILDEPTNFLDIQSVEALESLLKQYEGTVIFVTHDRRFVRNTATRILVFDHKQIRLFEGTYDQYKQSNLQKKRNNTEDRLMLLETRISEVLGRLSIEPSAELEQEFQRLLAEKKRLEKKGL